MAKEAQSAEDYKGIHNSLLVAGGPGGGKTQAIATLPGKKFVYTFDSNAMQTLKGFKNIDFVEFIPERIDLDAVTLKAGSRDDYSRAPTPHTYIEFEQDFEDRIEEDFFEDYDAICFDSSTTMHDILYDRIMHLNGRFGKWPEIADHTAVVNSFIKILRTASGLRKKSGDPLLFYLTCHTDYVKDDVTGRLWNQLAVTGAGRRRVPLIFANIWFCFSEPDKDNKPQWFVRTTPDQHTPFLRTAVRGLESVENVTIDDWKKPEGEGIGGLLNYKPE